MSNLTNSTLPKNAFDNTITLIKESNLTTKRESNVKEMVAKKLATKHVADSVQDPNISYSKELSHIIGLISNTLSDNRLSGGEIFTLKSFMSTIRGLKDSGNPKSAYILAKNALTYVAGVAFQYTDMTRTINKGPAPEVQVEISDTAKLYKSFTSEHISLEKSQGDDSFMDKGSLYSKII